MFVLYINESVGPDVDILYCVCFIQNEKLYGFNVMHFIYVYFMFVSMCVYVILSDRSLCLRGRKRSQLLRTKLRE